MPEADALERYHVGPTAGDPDDARQDDGGGRRDRLFRMNVLLFALPLSAGSRMVSDNTPVRVCPNYVSSERRLAVLLSAPSISLALFQFR
jgi:hypothetical protein